MTVRRKLLLLVFIPVLIATILAIIVSSIKIRNQGIAGLEDKSLTILALNIQEFVSHHQNGTSVFEEANKNDKSEKINYKFRISSLDPENPFHTATERDKQFIARFQKEKTDQITYIDKETDSLLVMRPVFMDKSLKCMECHAITKSGRHTSADELRGIFIVNSSMEETNAKVKSGIIDISIIGFIIVVLAIIIGITVVVKILSAIKQINKIARKVAEGDLQQEVNIHTGDELEELGNYINEMISSLNNVIVSVKNASRELTLATGEIASTSEKISQGAQDQARQFEELNNSFRFAADSAMKANDIIGASVNNAKVAETGMSQTIDSMVKIQESSGKINEAVKIINSISFQTNILALNAAVEAAHAGIHGRGFSVISSEVKKLSEITSNSSGEINLITADNLAQVENGMNIAQHAGENIKEIINSVVKIVELLKEISQANEQQSRIMDHNRGITNANAASSEVLSASAIDLDQQANKLLDIVKYFKLKES